MNINEFYQYEENIQFNENPTINEIFPLQTDELTKIKQTIISIPYISFVIQHHWNEIMDVNDLQTMIFQLSMIKRKIPSLKNLDISIVTKLYATISFYINEYLQKFSQQFVSYILLIYNLLLSFF